MTSTDLTQERTFRSWDGAELFYRVWQPKVRTEKALLLFHRGHEHSGRWQETVDRLGLDDVTIFAWDARGHGQSAGERGTAENVAVMAKDAEEFARHVWREFGFAPENTIALGHSVGAVIMAAWIHDFAPRLRAMVLATPAFRVKLYVPLAVPALRLKRQLLGPGYVKSYVKSAVLTHDPEQARAYNKDDEIFAQIDERLLVDLFDTSRRLIEDAGAITIPTLMIGAGADWVVHLSAQEQFFERLSSRIKRFELYPGFYHAVFHERDRARLVANIREFIVERFRQPAEPAAVEEADLRGYTKDEYDRLRQSGGLWKWLRYAPVRMAMKTVGRLSRGVALGWKSGFDSGVTLDYVYENRPTGWAGLGKLIDYSYLNAIGWRGIRLRRENLEKTLRREMEAQQAAGRPVRILDIAAGGGRYVLDTMHALRHVPSEAILRDYKEENLFVARRRADALGITTATMMLGDAFDTESLASMTPRPTIGIVSGLYELFPKNAPLRRSLAGLARAIEPGGVLIYTNQPWHPQVEFIARVLRNREGRPWVMRRRTQEEMDALVRAAGFEKVSQEVDPWGIFTVSVARRVGA